MKTIWNKETGEAREYESVDAREILKNSDVYTDVNPKPGDPKDPDRDGKEGGPQNVANVENEFRREPVGDDVPVKEREGVIIRNPVTDQPRMAVRAESVPQVAIPHDYKTMTLESRRALAVKMGGHGGMSESETDAVIKVEVDRRAKVAADKKTQADAAAKRAAAKSSSTAASSSGE